MQLGIKPFVDFAFKKLFGSPENKVSLIGLLNAILELPNPIVDVEILNPFSYQDFAGDKLIVLDIRARDTVGRLLNVEMQVAVYSGLLQRLVYYACRGYADQLSAGEQYATLSPSISICLLTNVLFHDTEQAHHRFQLLDRQSGRELGESIEVHTVELSKYNLQESTIRQAGPIEQWSFFFLFADRYEADRLRELLPGDAFQRAITVLETISQKTEDRTMYDEQEKALRDYQWALASARAEGKAEGRVEGVAQGVDLGLLVGKVQLLQSLLGETETSTPTLLGHSPDELSSLLINLQDRLRSRGDEAGR